MGRLDIHCFILGFIISFIVSGGLSTLFLLLFNKVNEIKPKKEVEPLCGYGQWLTNYRITTKS